MRPHPHLYEISAWPWLERLSSREGRQVTLADVPGERMGSHRGRGFDAVYLMGVWRRSPLGRLMARTDRSLLRDYDRALPGWSMRDVVGSPFSVQAYEPDERMGGWTGLDAARTNASRSAGWRSSSTSSPTTRRSITTGSAAGPICYVEGTLDNYRRSPDLFQPIDVGDRRSISSPADATRTFRRGATSRSSTTSTPQPATRWSACSSPSPSTATASAATWRCSCSTRCSPTRGAGRSICCGAAPSDEFWPAAIARAPQPDLPRRGLLGSRVGAAAAGISLHLRQAAARSTAPRRSRRRSAATCRPTRPTAQRLVRFLENHDEPRSAADLRRDVCPRRPRDCLCAFPGCGSSSTGSSRAPKSGRRCSSDDGRTKPPRRTFSDLYAAC